ncbi:MAG: MGMT family protein [Bacteroidia bacterium]
MPKTESFFESVYEVTRLIPKGRVTTYGSIAKYLGSAKSARMVGWAMNNAAAQIPPVPAHRVVNRKGLLTGKGHFADENEMQTRLESEGVLVKNEQIVNFKQHFWDTEEELSL